MGENAHLDISRKVAICLFLPSADFFLVQAASHCMCSAFGSSATAVLRFLRNFTINYPLPISVRAHGSKIIEIFLKHGSCEELSITKQIFSNCMEIDRQGLTPLAALARLDQEGWFPAHAPLPELLRGLRVEEGIQVDGPAYPECMWHQ